MTTAELYPDRALEKMMTDYGFTLTMEGDHTLIYEHASCGERIRFSQTGATPESIMEALDDHIRVCPKYQKGR